MELPLLPAPNPPSFLPKRALEESLSLYFSAYLWVNTLKRKWHHRLWSSEHHVVYLKDVWFLFANYKYSSVELGGQSWVTMKTCCDLPDTEGNKQQRPQEQMIFKISLLSCSCLPDDEIKLWARKHQHSQQSRNSAIQNRCEHVLQGKHGPAVLIANGCEKGLCNKRSVGDQS